jgi:hypothetical protein
VNEPISLTPSPAQEERQFLHDLATLIGTATLYTSMMQESRQWTHLQTLSEVQGEIDTLIRNRREVLAAKYE